jgi:hypothetical protein
MKLKFFGFCVVLASLLSTRAIGEPLVTISCDKPEGFNIAYGVSLTDASQNNQPGPTKPSLKGPTKDGYRGKPTFVIDSNKKNMTIGWTLLPEDAELKKQAKEAGLVRSGHRRELRHISQQVIQLASKNTFQSASFAHCEFSWATPK